jgi:hypothetical protein
MARFEEYYGRSFFGLSEEELNEIYYQTQINRTNEKNGRF